MGAKVVVYRGVQQLGVRALLPSSGAVLPTAESKDCVACCFFSHPTLTIDDIVASAPAPYVRPLDRYCSLVAPRHTSQPRQELAVN